MSLIQANIDELAQQDTYATDSYDKKAQRDQQAQPIDPERDICHFLILLIPDLIKVVKGGV